MRLFYQKTILILIGFLIAVLLFEIFLRFMAFPASSIYRVDERTGLLTFRPDEEIYIRSECFSNVIKTNSLGFHSKEYSLEKPENTFRIAIIGDSFIEASQVPIEKTFAYLLEEKLNNQPQKPHKYEIIPLGISSHGTYKSLLYLKAYALDFKPDLVIAAYSLNDLEDDAGEVIGFDEAGKPVLKISEAHSKSAVQKAEDFFKRNLRKSVLVTILRKEILLLKSRFENKTITDPLSTDPEKVSKVWETEDKLLFSFSDITKTAHSKFLLVFLADARIYSDVEIDESEKLKSISSYNAFQYFDLMPVFKARFNSENKTFTWSCDGHWNETGNEWAADALSDYLINSNLLKK